MPSGIHYREKERKHPPCCHVPLLPSLSIMKSHVFSCREPFCPHFACKTVCTRMIFSFFFFCLFYLFFFSPFICIFGYAYTGDQQTDIFEGREGSLLKRTRLDPNGNTIGDPIEHKSTAVVSDSPGEGCHVYGNLIVNKVSGNLHMAIGRSVEKSGKHLHNFNTRQVHLP